MIQSVINEGWRFVVFFYKFVISLALFIVLMKIPMWIRGFRLGQRKGKFQCLMCGNCCRLRIIELDEEDVEKLKKQGRQGFTDSNRFILRDRGRCVFLKNDKCTVHECRPRVCREFPFQKIFGLWFLPKITFCPGVDRLLEDGFDSKTR
ncbi:MAG: hypothetical protein GF334_10670 [Candidatus Altiarchaeales archaeon]|nr:hypothetical protein [Candidatus Altiarchaeales archaeon]